MEEEDEEVEGEEEVDEFAPFFANQKTPKLMVTTNRYDTSVWRFLENTFMQSIRVSRT